MLLTRDDFRTQVFARDGHRCVACGAPAQDAHHIVERRLFPDGGYYLDNGASVCGACHLQAEQTTLSPRRLRNLIGITRVVLPPHLYADQEYDKWGNIYLPDGRRAPGELFHDESVQRALQPVLHEFTTYVKHPRTHHLPWSPGINDDDRVIESMDLLDTEPVVISVKLDGEQTTMYRDHIHARSIDSAGHPSRSRVRAVWGRIAHEIPAGWRICGENMQAVHSIAYQGLPGVFLIHSIWNEHGRMLSHDDTVVWSYLLDLPMVPMLYEGMLVDAPWSDLTGATSGWADEDEGYVVRARRELSLREFRVGVAKYVRYEHVGPDRHHWFARRVVENGLDATVGSHLAVNQAPRAR